MLPNALTPLSLLLDPWSLFSGSWSRCVLTGGVRVLGVGGFGVGDGVDRGSLIGGDGGEGDPSLSSGVELIRFLERGDGDFVAGEPEVG